MVARDIPSEIRRLGDINHELMLCTTILRYAQSGHATPLMIEQAIEIVDGVLTYARAAKDETWLTTGENLRANLCQALIDGVHTLRVVKGPGPEVTLVERPLAEARIARGHNIRRQHRCSTGIIDIYDLTADEIIECKHRGTNAALGEAGGQLRRYGRVFPGARLTIAVLSVDPAADWLAELLRRDGITIIEMGRDQ